jgi:hypothetical protein
MREKQVYWFSWLQIIIKYCCVLGYTTVQYGSWGQCFERIYCFHLQDSSWYPPITQHSVIVQKITIWIFTLLKPQVLWVLIYLHNWCVHFLAKDWMILRLFKKKKKNFLNFRDYTALNRTGIWALIMSKYGFWEKWLWFISLYCPSIYLDRLRKPMKPLNQNS